MSNRKHVQSSGRKGTRQRMLNFFSAINNEKMNVVNEKLTRQKNWS